MSLHNKSTLDRIQSKNKMRGHADIKTFYRMTNNEKGVVLYWHNALALLYSNALFKDILVKIIFW